MLDFLLVRRALVCAPLSFLLIPQLAHAEPDRTASPPPATTDAPSRTDVSLDALVGGGVTIGGENLHGFGGGLRVGATFPDSFYVGALALFHLGSTDPGEPDVHHHSQDAGLEVGYSIRFAPLTLRPTLRGGLALITTPRDVDDHFVSPHLGLGLTFLAQAGSAHFGLDLDTRLYTRLVDNGDNAYSNLGLDAYAVAGVGF